MADTDLYETDKEMQNRIDWVCLSEQIKENNNTIRNLTGEYRAGLPGGSAGAVGAHETTLQGAEQSV